MSKKLTEEQIEAIDKQIVERWREWRNNPPPLDKEQFEKDLHAYHALYDCGEVPVTWFKGPGAIIEAVGGDRKAPAFEHLRYFLIPQQNAADAAQVEFEIACGNEMSKEQIAATKLTWHGVWMYLMPDEIYACPPPDIYMDDQDRLHRPDGPAVYWPEDDFGFSFWRGMRVPRRWIDNKASITPDEVWKLRNIEMRRVAAEIAGWAQLIKGLNPTILDMDEDFGVLLEADIPDGGPTKFVYCICGTGREFAVMAPKESTTVLDALAMVANLPAEDYKLLQRRT